MKIKPEILLIKKNIEYQKILVTGTDEPLISYLTEFITKEFKKKNYYINTSLSSDGGLMGDLFSGKKILNLLKDFSPSKEILAVLEMINDPVLISCNNGKKINSLKSKFLKSKDCLLVECYPLNRSGKEMVIQNFIKTNKISLSTDVYWYCLENFDNNYVLLSKQLHLVSLFNTKIDNVQEIENAIFVENKIELNKMLFQVFKNNKTLIKIFNKNIYTQSDFYIFLNSLKTYLGIIGDSSNKDEALEKFPRYLFNEKEVFIKIFNNLNKEKIIKIYNNILKVESLIRKNSGLFLVIGLRFLINTKKIIIS
jgi:DNA polymerase III delta subunit